MFINSKKEHLESVIGNRNNYITIRKGKKSFEAGIPWLLIIVQYLSLSQGLWYKTPVDA